MKSLKKTLVLLVVLSMILSAVSPVFAFNDVIAEEYAEQANKMAAFGVFAGDADGNFNADAEITRAEMAVIIGKLMGLTENEANANKVYNSNFSDVVAGDWYTGWVNLVAGRGIISGFPDGTFRPNEKVTQAQAVTMIVKSLGWGVVVDQTGTWPANYITKASELRLFKNAVSTNSELVTRGNVAIYCYNALTAKTWDVTESTDGKLTSSKTSDTILAKYFSDFTNEAGEMKLVEDATVVTSGAIKNSMGANQVELSVPANTFKDAKGNDIGLAGFIDAEDEPRRGKEEATYVKDASTDVIAYVPAEVANIASLTNKKVDVIFGKDNVVAYLIVTDEMVEEAYVTAWKCAADFSEAEITIDGEVYDIDPDTTKPVTLSVYGHKVDTGIEAINTILSSYLVTNSRNLKRNVVADFTVNADDEINSIDLKLATYTDGTNKIYVDEYVVTKVSSKKLTTVGKASSLTIADLEKEDPRIIKNGEIATLDDIEAGNVLTVVSFGGTAKYETIYVTDNTVEGMVDDYVTRTNVVELDGEEYFASLYDTDKVFTNTDGEVDKLTDSDAADLASDFEDKDVTVYFNLVGEVVAVVGESEATGMTLGIITNDYEDRLFEDDNDEEVSYLKVKILTEDGSKKIYKIYSSKKTSAEKSIENDSTYYATVKGFAAGTVVVFEADANKVIKADKISAPVMKTQKYAFGSLNEVYGHEYAISAIAVDTDVNSVTVDGATKTVKIDDDRKTIDGNKFTSSTVVFNKNTKSIETITEWDSLIKRDTNKFVKTTGNVVLFTQNNRIAYIVLDVDKTVDGYGTTDTQYGVFVNSKASDDEETLDYIVTMLVDGETATFECATNLKETYSRGDIISFALTDNELANPALLVGVAYLAELENVEDDETLPDETNNNVAAALVAGKTNLDYIKVKDVDEEDNYIVFENAAASLEYLASDYVAYDLATGEVSEEDLVGSYVLLANENKDGEYELVIIVK